MTTSCSKLLNDNLNFGYSVRSAQCGINCEPHHFLTGLPKEAFNRTFFCLFCITHFGCTFLRIQCVYAELVQLFSLVRSEYNCFWIFIDPERVWAKWNTKSAVWSLAHKSSPETNCIRSIPLTALCLKIQWIKYFDLEYNFQRDK